jgi:putative MATE family efflux protein
MSSARSVLEKSVLEKSVLQKSLWSLAWPLFWSLLLTFALSFVDAFFLSRVSDSAAAAVGALLPVLSLTVMVFSPVSQAGASVASQLLGAGRKEDVPATYVALIALDAAMGLLASLSFIVLGAYIPRWLGLEGEMAEHAATYLRIVGGGQVLKAVQIGFTNILNSRGDTRWVMAEALLTNVFHIFSNLAFLTLLPEWGVRGIACSTLLSLLMGMSFTMLVVRFKLSVRLPWDTAWPVLWQRLRPILRIGLPGAAEPMSFQAMQLVLNTLLIGLGTQVLAARVYAMNFFIMTTVLWSVALGIATQIAIAHRVGAGLYEDAHRMLLRSLKIAMTGNVALCALLALLHPWLLGLLTKDPAILAAAHPVFWIAPLVEAGRAANIVAGGALRSCGDARYTAIRGSLLMWLVGVPAAYLLSTPLGLGLSGIWLAMGLDEGIRGVMNYLRWRSGHWREQRIVSRIPPQPDPATA